MKTNTSHLRHFQKSLEISYHAYMRSCADDAQNIIKELLTAKNDGLTRPSDTPRRQRKPQRRPDKEKIQTIKKQLHLCICAHPGENAIEISERLHVSISDLKYPIRCLREDKRIRSVGQGKHTFYFPIGAEADSAS